MIANHVQRQHHINQYTAYRRQDAAPRRYSLALLSLSRSLSTLSILAGTRGLAPRRNSPSSSPSRHSPTLHECHQGLTPTVALHRVPRGWFRAPVASPGGFSVRRLQCCSDGRAAHRRFSWDDLNFLSNVEEYSLVLPAPSASSRMESSHTPGLVHSVPVFNACGPPLRRAQVSNNRYARSRRFRCLPLRRAPGSNVRPLYVASSAHTLQTSVVDSWGGLPPCWICLCSGRIRHDGREIRRLPFLVHPCPTRDRDQGSDVITRGRSRWCRMEENILKAYFWWIESVFMRLQVTDHTSSNIISIEIASHGPYL
jgi:hypothetical protein